MALICGGGTPSNDLGELSSWLSEIVLCGDQYHIVPGIQPWPLACRPCKLSCQICNSGILSFRHEIKTEEIHICARLLRSKRGKVLVDVGVTINYTDLFQIAKLYIIDCWAAGINPEDTFVTIDLSFFVCLVYFDLV